MRASAGLDMPALMSRPEHEKMKTKNTYVPARFDLVVTRHAPLVEYLIREGYIDDSTPVVEHAHAHARTAKISLRRDVYDVICGGTIARDLDVLEAQALADGHNAANVRGKHVIGVLPHHLSSKAASVTEVQLDWTLEDRKAMQQSGDLDVEAVARAARGLHTYVVRRAEAQHMHSAAVEAAWRYVERHGTSFGAGPGIISWAGCESVRGLDATLIGSGCEQAHAQIIMSRGLWRPQSKGPWLDGLGREVEVDDIEPAAGWPE